MELDFTDYYPTFKEYLEENHPHNYVRTVDSTVRKLVNYAAGNNYIADTEDVNGFVRFLSEFFEEAPLTKQDVYLPHLRKFLTFIAGTKSVEGKAEIEKLVDSVSVNNFEGFKKSGPIGQPNLESIERQLLADEEVEAALEASETLREELTVRFLYETGCRRSEVAAITPDGIDFNPEKNAATIKIDKKENPDGSVDNSPKWGSERTVGISEKTKRLLQEHIEERDVSDDNRVFLSAATINEDIKKVFTRADVRVEDERSTVTSHNFRHTRATKMLDDGWRKVDVQQWLGHKSVENVEVYTHFIDKDEATEVYTDETLEMY